MSIDTIVTILFAAFAALVGAVMQSLRTSIMRIEVKLDAQARDTSDVREQLGQLKGNYNALHRRIDAL